VTSDGRQRLQTTHVSSQANLLCLSAAVVVFAFLGFFRLGSTTLFVDEVTRASQAALPAPALISQLRNDIQPPLYMLVLRAWSMCFGASDIALRSLSVVIGMCHVVLLWATWHTLGMRGRWLCAPILVLAASPAFVDYSRLAFSWPLFAVLVSAVVFFLTRLQCRESPMDLGGLVIVSTAALYTNYLAGVIMVVGACAWFAWRRRFAARVSWCVAWLLASALLFLPWLPTFVHQWMNDISDTPSRAVWSRIAVLLARLASVAYQFAIGDTANPGQFLLSAVTLVLVTFFLWKGVRVSFQSRSAVALVRPQALRSYLLLHLCVLVGCLLTIGFLHGELHFMFTAERLLFSMPCLALLVGLGVASSGRRALAAIALSALVGCLHLQYYTEASYYNWAYHTHWDRYGEQIARVLQEARGQEVPRPPVVAFDNYAFGRVGERYFSSLGRYVNVADGSHRGPNPVLDELLTSASTLVCIASARDTSPDQFVSRNLASQTKGLRIIQELTFLEEPDSWQRLKRLLRPGMVTPAKVRCIVLTRTDQR
jgi:hypothetical protein